MASDKEKLLKTARKIWTQSAMLSAKNSARLSKNKILLQKVPVSNRLRKVLQNPSEHLQKFPMRSTKKSQRLSMTTPK